MEPNKPSIHIDTSHYTSVPLSPITHSYDTAIDSHSSSSIDNPSPVKINIVHIEEASHPVISNIEEEANLKQYTDNHFVSITNNDISFVSNNIPSDVLAYYTPVYYYDLEVEKNEGNKISVVDQGECSANISSLVLRDALMRQFFL